MLGYTRNSTQNNNDFRHYKLQTVFFRVKIMSGPTSIHDNFILENSYIFYSKYFPFPHHLFYSSYDTLLNWMISPKFEMFWRDPLWFVSGSSIILARVFPDYTHMQLTWRDRICLYVHYIFFKIFLFPVCTLKPCFLCI